MSWAMDELEARAQAQLNGLHEFSEKLGRLRCGRRRPTIS